MKASFKSIDIGKLLFSLSILTCHVLSCPTISECNSYLKIYWVLYYVLNRIAVPFFFICTGYFLSNELSQKNGYKRVWLFTKKIIRIYIVWTIIYSPFIIFNNSPIVLLQRTLFQGSVPVFWYLTSLIIAVNLLFVLIKYFGKKIAGAIAVITYSFGIFVSYIPDGEGLLFQIIHMYKKIFITFANGLFFGLIFVFIGVIIGQKENGFIKNKRTNQDNKHLRIIGLFIATMISIFAIAFEVLMRQTNNIREDNFILCLPIAGITVFLLIKELNKLTIFELIKDETSIKIRKLSTLIYCLHMFIVYIYIFLGFTNDIFRWIFTFTFTLIIAMLLLWLGKKNKAISSILI